MYEYNQINYAAGLCGAIGQRVRLLTERLVIRAQGRVLLGIDRGHTIFFRTRSGLDSVVVRLSPSCGSPGLKSLMNPLYPKTYIIVLNKSVCQMHKHNIHPFKTTLIFSKASPTKKDGN